MMLAFSPQAMLWMLKRLVDEQGGEVTFGTGKDMAETMLFFEGSEDGESITLKLVRVSEEGAGHA